MQYRIEKDTMGKVEVPADVYWGAQTQRSIENFKIAQDINKMPKPIIQAFAYLKKAAAQGVRFSINPDAHSPEGLKDTAYGIGIARKGWLTKKEVVNTMPLEEMEKFLSK